MTALAGPLGPGHARWGGTAGTSWARTLRAFEHGVMLYRRTWRGSIIESFFGPVLFLLAMGVGLGGYVDRATGGVGGVPYVAFLAPGLMAANIMQTAASEGTFPIMSGFVWDRRFHAMHASPLTPADIAMGHFLFVTVRLLGVSAIFVGVMAAFGLVHSPWVLAAIPACALMGLAFNAPITAFAARQKTMEKFNYVFRFVVTPLFLFSGTFFPIDRLPAFLQPVAWATPLYHGVALSRAFALGTALDDPAGTLAHVGVLAAYAAFGVWASLRAFQRRLEP